MEPNNHNPESRVIPPRALRSDVPGGTAWVPRWKWAGRLFGREVQLPSTIHSAPGIPAADLPVADSPAATKPTPPEVNGTVPEESCSSRGQVMYPLFAILTALILAYGLGVTFGYVLAAGKPPAWMSGSVVGAFLLAPSGGILLFLAGLACLVQATDDRGARIVWWLAGSGFFVLFLLATFGGLL
ncbi:hypothetical protein ACQUQQ_00960 [Acidithiobacillus ferrooxidans]|uniref:hypothetical protein n=1 Tax=Acidithiobacillus TaxID=119977 RepID=UPI001C07842C|nr:hypothetical protein [Acidithiobacillus ferridurans]MBU2803627.1 hypothetical protein [Acidithiobacillus ferridurans]